MRRLAGLSRVGYPSVPSNVCPKIGATRRIFSGRFEVCAVVERGPPFANDMGIGSARTPSAGVSRSDFWPTVFRRFVCECRTIPY